MLGSELIQESGHYSIEIENCNIINKQNSNVDHNNHSSNSIKDDDQNKSLVSNSGQTVNNVNNSKSVADFVNSQIDQKLTEIMNLKEMNSIMNDQRENIDKYAKNKRMRKILWNIPSKHVNQKDD